MPSGPPSSSTYTWPRRRTSHVAETRTPHACHGGARKDRRYAPRTSSTPKSNEILAVEPVTAQFRVLVPTTHDAYRCCYCESRLPIRPLMHHLARHDHDRRYSVASIHGSILPSPVHHGYCTTQDLQTGGLFHAVLRHRPWLDVTQSLDATQNLIPRARAGPNRIG